MLKNLLIAVGILAILGVVGIVFLGNKIDSKLKEKEPEFRQYIAMTTEEQNAYAQKNIATFLQSFGNEDTAEFITASRNNPEIAEAETKFTRAAIAQLILANENIVKDLTPEQKAQLQSEVNEFDSRSETYQKLIEKFKAESKN